MDNRSKLADTVEDRLGSAEIRQAGRNEEMC